MEEDNFDDISFLPSRHILIKAGGIFVAVLALAGAIWALAEIPNNSKELTYAGSLQPTGRERPTPSTLRQGMQVDPSKAIGTSGRTAITEPGDADASPAVIRDLETIIGNADATTLVGRRVDLHVPVLRESSLVTFATDTNVRCHCRPHTASSPSSTVSRRRSRERFSARRRRRGDSVGI